jgi:hypothetical protein
MPVTVKVQAAGYTLMYCEGLVTIDDLAKANEIIYSKLDPQLARYQIVDTRDMTDMGLPSEGLRRLASQDVEAAQRLESVAIAVVAPRDLSFGLSRVWQAYSDAPGVTSAVFRDFQSAEDWILSLRRKTT